MAEEKRSFQDFLTDIDNGSFHEELTAAAPGAILEGRRCVTREGRGGQGNPFSVVGCRFDPCQLHFDTGRAR